MSTASFRPTDREIEIATLFADGLCAKEIAQRLNLSPKTVDAHRTNLMGKLHTHTSAGMVRVMIEQGFIPIDYSMAKHNAARRVVKARFGNLAEPLMDRVVAEILAVGDVNAPGTMDVFTQKLLSGQYEKTAA